MPHLQKKWSDLLGTDMNYCEVDGKNIVRVSASSIPRVKLLVVFVDLLES